VQVVSLVKFSAIAGCIVRTGDVAGGFAVWVTAGIAVSVDAISLLALFEQANPTSAKNARKIKSRFIAHHPGIY
jgi:hypothetical protein